MVPLAEAWVEAQKTDHLQLLQLAGIFSSRPLPLPSL